MERIQTVIVLLANQTETDLRVLSQQVDDAFDSRQKETLSALEKKLRSAI